MEDEHSAIKHISVAVNRKKKRGERKSKWAASGLALC